MKFINYLKTKFNKDVEKCPYCNCENLDLKPVGDDKQFLIFFCPNCRYRTPLHWWEDARYTKYGARKIWNKRANEVKMSV